MFSEIKYDGERVQVHKKGDHFSYFSRSLKPVLPHKVIAFSQDSLLPACKSHQARTAGPFQLYFTEGNLFLSVNEWN